MAVAPQVAQVILAEASRAARHCQAVRAQQVGQVVSKAKEQSQAVAGPVAQFLYKAHRNQALSPTYLRPRRAVFDQAATVCRAAPALCPAHPRVEYKACQAAG